MWTEEHRRIYRGEGAAYPSDLRDAEWARLEPLIPEASPSGRPRKTDIRAAMNAIFLLRTGSCAICPATAFRRDLGRAAYRVAGADGPGAQPVGSGSRQPIDQVHNDEGRQIGS